LTFAEERRASFGFIVESSGFVIHRRAFKRTDVKNVRIIFRDGKVTVAASATDIADNVIAEDELESK
jgi:hypothetical protein